MLMLFIKKVNLFWFFIFLGGLSYLTRRSLGEAYSYLISFNDHTEFVLLILWLVVGAVLTLTRNNSLFAILAKFQSDKNNEINKVFSLLSYLKSLVKKFYLKQSKRVAALYSKKLRLNRRFNLEFTRVSALLEVRCRKRFSNAILRIKEILKKFW